MLDAIKALRCPNFLNLWDFHLSSLIFSSGGFDKSSNSGGALNSSMSHHESRVTRRRKLNKIDHFLAQKIYFSAANFLCQLSCFYIPVKFLESSDVHQKLRASKARIWNYEPFFMRIVSQVLNSMVASNCVNFTQMFEANVYENHILCKLIRIAFKWFSQCFDWSISSRMRFKPLNHLGHAINKLWYTFKY